MNVSVYDTGTNKMARWFVKRLYYSDVFTFHNLVMHCRHDAELLEPTLEILSEKNLIENGEVNPDVKSTILEKVEGEGLVMRLSL